MTGTEVAALLAKAGWKGDDLALMLAIAHRESRWKPEAFNGNKKTGDESYGLFQINMLGKLGPARRKAFGIRQSKELFDPVVNVRAARVLWKWGIEAHKDGFWHWVGYRNASIPAASLAAAGKVLTALAPKPAAAVPVAAPVAPKPAVAPVATVAAVVAPEPVYTSGQWPLVTKQPLPQGNTVVASAVYLQAALNHLGITSSDGKPLVVDGRPGAKTMSAVAKLQWTHHIGTEANMVGRWTWYVLDHLVYSGWTPAPDSVTSPTVVKDSTGKVLYRDPQPRTAAIYKGHNRYTGIAVNDRGIIRETQKMSDALRLSNPSWGQNFVAVDRYMATGHASPHRWGFARDWMTDIDHDGNYKEPAEIAKCDALVAYAKERMLGWPVQSITVKMRGDYAKGIAGETGTNGQPVALTSKTFRFSGPDRIGKIVWNGWIGVHERVLEDGQMVWRFVWRRLNPGSDQHSNHVHIESYPVIGGVFL